ncbi:MAG: 16S rRNA (guanine(527)-N(7))-methyltransferase RsmG [Prolixibacteraceae bacterium]|nr:16S rRNA (guanine(527)-N(7))-methyltransferase RsmG [Prolixibacteraceae bacterium]
MGMEIIEKYFPKLDKIQRARFEKLDSLYRFWNHRINLISRKDIDALYEKHVLHSLAIAQFIRFEPGTKILDAGTGGGFPGIPLAIFFPDVKFHLVDSIGKKIKVVTDIAAQLQLDNVAAQQIRVEQLTAKYDFVVSRAVTAFPEFVKWIRKNISPENSNAIPNGVIYLKGGDLQNELKPFGRQTDTTPLSHFFEENFFETKKLVYMPVYSRRNAI